MRRALHLLLVLTALASAAVAAPAAKPKTPIVATLGLRGTVAPDVQLRQSVGGDGGRAAAATAAAREPILYGAQRAIPPLPPASTPIGGMAQQCRMACAQTYYFCLAGMDADECASSWSQCRAGCSAQTLSSSY